MKKLILSMVLASVASASFADYYTLKIHIRGDTESSTAGWWYGDGSFEAHTYPSLQTCYDASYDMVKDESGALSLRKYHRANSTNDNGNTVYNKVYKSLNGTSFSWKYAGSAQCIRHEGNPE